MTKPSINTFNNLSVLGLSRSGSTIVSQVLSCYLHAKGLNYHPVFQGEITNAYRNHFMVDDVVVTKYVDKAYTKKYDFDKDGFLTIKKDYSRQIPMNDNEANECFYTNLYKLSKMCDRKQKSVFKFHPFPLRKYYNNKRTFDVLKKMNFIYIKRENTLEHFLSFIIAKATGIYYTSEPITYPTNIIMTDKHKEIFIEYLESEKYVIEKLQSNIIKEIKYEDITDNHSILTLLGLTDWSEIIITDINYKKRIDYGCKKLDLIDNKEELLEFYENNIKQ